MPATIVHKGKLENINLTVIPEPASPTSKLNNKGEFIFFALNVMQSKDYLDSFNHQLEPEQWLITCERFAPNAPQQNPIEDKELQAKKLIREFYFFCHSFCLLKELFELAVDCHIFNFPKFHDSGVFS